MGLAVVGMHGRRTRDVRTGFVVDRCSFLRLEARRSSGPQDELSLSLDSPYTTKFLAPEEGDIRPPKSLRFFRCGVVRKKKWLHNARVFKPRRFNKEHRV